MTAAARSLPAPPPPPWPAARGEDPGRRGAAAERLRDAIAAGDAPGEREALETLLLAGARGVWLLRLFDTVQRLARGKDRQGRPFSGEAARQMAREVLVARGARW